MTDQPEAGAAEAPAPDWWQASDGRWYPPETQPAAAPQGADTQQGPGWWLASDGRWYPPETASPPPPSPPAAVSKGITGTLRGFLVGGGILGALAGVASVNEALTFSSFFEGGSTSFSDLESAEDLAATAQGFWVLAAITVFVLIVIWLYQAYRAVDAHGVAGTAWSQGWAVGGWFIPIANFVIPKLVVNEVDRISTAAEQGHLDTWRQQRTLSVSNGWWLAFVIAGVLVLAGGSITESQLDSSNPDFDLYETGLWIQAVGFFAYGMAGVLGAATIKALGDRLT